MMRDQRLETSVRKEKDQRDELISAGADIQKLLVIGILLPDCFHLYHHNYRMDSSSHPDSSLLLYPTSVTRNRMNLMRGWMQPGALSHCCSCCWWCW